MSCFGKVTLVRKDGTTEKRDITEQEILHNVIMYDKGKYKDAFIEMVDNVNHPTYYKRGNIEVADFIDDQQLDWKEASVIQYICRWRHKNGVEDLRKAEWYLKRMIRQEEERIANNIMENTE